MSVIHLVPVGDADRRRLEAVRVALATEFGASCHVGDQELDPAGAYHPGRRQYHSTELLGALDRSRGGGDDILLGVAGVDLFIPILTFVFGEAQFGGRCAVVSSHRLRQEYYGLPVDEAKLTERLVKEAVHEVGHLFSLHHCEDYLCAMAPAHSVEWIDLKGRWLCLQCRTAAGLGTGAQQQ